MKNCPSCDNELKEIKYAKIAVNIGDNEIQSLEKEIEELERLSRTNNPQLNNSEKFETRIILEKDWKDFKVKLLADKKAMEDKHREDITQAKIDQSNFDISRYIALKNDYEKQKSRIEELEKSLEKLSNNECDSCEKSDRSKIASLESELLSYKEGQIKDIVDRQVKEKTKTLEDEVAIAKDAYETEQDRRKRAENENAKLKSTSLTIEDAQRIINKMDKKKGCEGCPFSDKEKQVMICAMSESACDGIKEFLIDRFKSKGIDLEKKNRGLLSRLDMRGVKNDT